MTAMHRSPQSPVVVIGGMHRSGTSCVAGLLHSAGLFLGDRLLAADPSNPRGHYEDLEFLEFHRELLRAHGFPDDGFIVDQPLEPTGRFVRRAAALVAERRRLMRPWGWKDPRTSLLLPFWHGIVPDARFLFVFRPPWDVVDSLYRRGDPVFARDPSFAVRVWLDYNTRIRDFARAHADCTLVRELSQIVADPDALCDDVRHRLNVTLDPPRFSVEPRLLRPASAAHAELLATTNPACVALYRDLQDLAGGAPIAPPATMPDESGIPPGGMAEWQRSRQPANPRRMARGQRVFIGVPVYRGEAFVAETLRSIQQQEHQDFQVCISVDAADERSAERCRPFLGDPRFELHVQSDHLGWAANLNWLMARCDGDFFCFWQQDDLAATNFLRRLVSHATHDPQVACVFADVQWFGSRIDRVESSSLTGFALERVLQQIEYGHYVPFFGLVRAEALAAAGPIRLTPYQSALEDQVWLARLAGVGPWHRVPGTLYFKRSHAAETHLDWESGAEEASRRAIWLEWGAGMLAAALAVSPPQEHGRLFDLLAERLTKPRPGRSLFHDAGATGVDAVAKFVADFAAIARHRFDLVGARDRLLDGYTRDAAEQGRIEIAIAAGEPGLALLGGGWADPEGGGVWSDGTEALVRLPVPATGTWQVALDAQPYREGHGRRAIEVRSDDRIIATWVCESADAGGGLRFVPPNQGPVVLQMRWAVSPESIGKGGDHRRLGICLHRIVIERISGHPS
jgi:glycosyltransferase involved in cell wall biosynthesis